MGNASARGRRRVLKDGLCLGVGLTLSPAWSFGQDEPPARRRPQEGDFLVRTGDADASPLTPDAIKRGDTQTLAWALDPQDGTVRSGSRLNLVVLLRFDPGELSPETRSRAADGVVGYTAICTHTGCEVEEWLAEKQLLYCGCHASMFDPRDGARVVEGPAPRGLPALPLKIVESRLVVADAFTARVGFQAV
jgi:rieske iron-sulfur protein